MIVEISVSEDNDERLTYSLEATNGAGEVVTIDIGQGEPEDMTLYRDLSDVYELPDLIKMAYEAGKSGEKLVFKDHTNETR